MDQGGIYRVNGSTREVKELLEQFRLGHLPNLSQIEDINVVCSALKTFLMNLDEPIVTHDLQPSFVKVADMQEDQVNWNYTFNLTNQFIVICRLKRL